jgi:hypothetical protein
MRTAHASFLASQYRKSNGGENPAAAATSSELSQADPAMQVVPAAPKLSLRASGSACSISKVVK